MTATEKWDDPFFFNLSCENKLIWIYLLDKCNHAGIIDFNEKVASFFIGSPIAKKDIVTIFKDRLQVLPSGKFYIPKFIEFQYGELVETNNTHKSVLAILKKEGVAETIQISPSDIEISECMEISLKDEKWVRLNSTNRKELELFNENLNKQGIYYKTPIDYKKHFSNWKKKQPDELKTAKTFIYK